MATTTLVSSTWHTRQAGGVERQQADIACVSRSFEHAEYACIVKGVVGL